MISTLRKKIIPLAIEGLFVKLNLLMKNYFDKAHIAFAK